MPRRSKRIAKIQRKTAAQVPKKAAKVTKKPRKYYTYRGRRIPILPGPPAPEPHRASVPSNGIQLMDLPREIRAMIFGYAREPPSVPLRERTASGPYRFPFLDSTPSYNFPSLFDCGLLGVNRQIRQEAYGVLLRTMVTDYCYLSRQVMDAASRDPALKARLTYILERAKDLRIDVPHVNRFAWYMRILESRTDLECVHFHIHDFNFTLMKRWDRNEAATKEELKVWLADLPDNADVTVSYEMPAYLYPIPLKSGGPNQVMQLDQDIHNWVKSPALSMIRS